MGIYMDKALLFADRAAFRGWLADNHETSQGVWLLFGKKGGPRTLTAAEALEEALCFGWIDGQMQRIDETSYRKYFAHRTDKSNWSEKNKKLATSLAERGSMAPHGLAVMERAKANGTWDAPPPGAITEAQVADFMQVLAPYALAYENFMGMSPSVRRTYTGFYLDTKSDKARQARLERIVDRLERGLKPM